MGMFLAPAMFVAPGGCKLRSAFQVDRVFGVTTLFFLGNGSVSLSPEDMLKPKRFQDRLPSTIFSEAMLVLGSV